MYGNQWESYMLLFSMRDRYDEESITGIVADNGFCGL